MNTHIQFTLPLRLTARHLAALFTDGPIPVVYQNAIVGKVVPLNPPIPFPRGSDDAGIAEAYQEAMETVGMEHD